MFLMRGALVVVKKLPSWLDVQIHNILDLCADERREDLKDDRSTARYSFQCRMLAWQRESLSLHLSMAASLKHPRTVARRRIIASRSSDSKNFRFPFADIQNARPI